VIGLKEMDEIESAKSDEEQVEESAPRPTYAPAAMAMGIMLLFWGLVTHWFASLTGLALMTYALGKWIQEVRHGWEERS
jgi:hypothetical protein